MDPPPGRKPGNGIVLSHDKLRIADGSLHVTNGGLDFGNVVGGQLIAEQSTSREVYEPGHPMADAAGMVHYPATDVVEEMTSLMTASRSYDANVRSFNLLRSMLLRALEIGAK